MESCLFKDSVYWPYKMTKTEDLWLPKRGQDQRQATHACILTEAST